MFMLIFTKNISVKQVTSKFYNFITHQQLQHIRNIKKFKQMQKSSDQPHPPIPHHTVHRFSELKQPEIFFNSCFDSGNMSKVNRNSYDHYSIWTAADAEGTSNPGYPKSWFYFQVGGFSNRKVAFSIHRVHFLWSVSKRSNLYRPVCNVIYQDSETKWQRLPHPIISLNLNQNQELVLKFDFFFTKDIKSVKFAFIYPFSYEQQRNEVLRLKSIYEDKDKEIFFKQYELIKSYQQRVLDLIIISSHEGKEGYQNIKFDEYFNFGQKLVKFRNNKPIIFVSARVHPIQTPSSYCMKGIIDFLLDKKDYRAYLLRKYFVFALVPMLNPDGVSNGHCRMDQLNQNLNRYYNNPDPVKQSPCYAVRKLCEHYQKDSRMFMYLDLHAHPAIKGNFMFGNAIYDFIEQVQSQVFPKILSQNCINFQFENCIFSRRHMKAKDRFEDMNKEGCGRVVLYKDFGIPHAYTLQCGYHMNSYNNNIQPQKNTEKKFIVRYSFGKNKQKIYENIEKLYSNIMLAKIEETIIKNEQKIHQNEETIDRNEEEKQQTIQMNMNDCQKLNASQEEKEQIGIPNRSNEIKTSNKSEQVQEADIRISDKIIQKREIKRRIRKSITNKNKQETEKPPNSPQVKPSCCFYDGYQIFQFTSSTYDNIENSYYKRQLPIYDVESFENLGRNIIITVLDIFNKNPYSRGIDLNDRRKEIAEKQSKLDRFRKQQAGIRNKMKNIVQLIEDQFYSPWIKRNVFTHVDTAFQDRIKKIKLAQFQIVRSSQHKMRKSTKQVSNLETKKPLMLESQVIKTSLGYQNQKETGMSYRFDSQKHTVEEDQKYTLLSNKIRSFKSKQKVQLKLLCPKQGNVRDEIKKSLQLPTSQNIINLQQEIKVVKNEGLCLSSKILKHPTYNMASLRIRNFMMQGSNAFSSNYGYIVDTKFQHAHSLGNDARKG